MKKLNIIRCILIVPAFLLVSCTNWLDVPPRDKVLDDEVYSNEARIMEALNGIYLSMSKAELYGKNLTWNSVELLSQRYSFSPTSYVADEIKYMPKLVALEYDEKEVRAHLDGIFSQAYNVILGINYFMERLQATEGILAERKKNLMLGEAYALRAFMHLDMLRMYGPVPSDSPEGLAIPYITQPNTIWQDRKSHSEVIRLILQDIETALTHLANDPVVTEGVVRGEDADEEDPDFFYQDYRNRRMNYFAVQGLKVRTLMYSATPADIQAAGQLAKTLIENPAFKKAFPWTRLADFSGKGEATFPHEALFGIHVGDMYKNWQDWFSPGIESFYHLFTASRANLNYMFTMEAWSASGDWRATQLSPWPKNADLFVYSKFQQQSNTEDDVLYFQPLMRKSEIFLVAAEVLQDHRYVDSIRVNRGLMLLSEDPNTANYDLQEEIEKEYMKDFVGEGQLFYYYKRRNQEKIRDHIGGVRTVTTGNYTLPVPDKETNV